MDLDQKLFVSVFLSQFNKHFQGAEAQKDTDMNRKWHFPLFGEYYRLFVEIFKL